MRISDVLSNRRSLKKLNCVLNSQSFSPAKEKGYEKIVNDMGLDKAKRLTYYLYTKNFYNRSKFSEAIFF